MTGFFVSFRFIFKLSLFNSFRDLLEVFTAADPATGLTLQLSPGISRNGSTLNSGNLIMAEFLGILVAGNLGC
jgi:hypothetical protein